MRILLLLLIPIVLFSQPDLTKLDSLKWYAAAVNTLADLNPDDGCGNNENDILQAWSSSAYDRFNHRMLVFGGGHSDWYGNEVWAFSAVTFTWSEAEAQSGTIPCNDTVCDDSLSDGKPTSRHTYDGLEFMDHDTNFVLIGGSRACNPGNGADDTWTWNENDGWTQKNDGELHYELGRSMVYNTSDSCMYMQEYDGLKKWNPITNQVSDLGGSNLQNDDYTACFYPDSNWMVIIGGTYFHQYDLDDGSPSLTSISTTGGSTIINAEAPGIDYDPVADMFVAYANGKVWAVSSSGGAWTQHDLTGQPTGGELAFSRMIYGHWRYMPEYNCFMLINDTTEDSVYFFKHKIASGEWNARSTQDSVVLAFDFDDSTETVNYLHRDEQDGEWDISQWVSDVYASGEGSLRMTSRDDDDYGGTNDWKINFSDLGAGSGLPDPATKFKGFGSGDLGSTFWVQFRQRFDSTMLDNIWDLSAGRGGWKQCIIGNGDDYPWVWDHENPPASEEGSATQNEIVLNNAELRGAPAAYHANPGFFDIDVGLDTESDGTYQDAENSEWHKGRTFDAKFQNVLDAGAQSHPFKQYALFCSYRDSTGSFGESINYQYYTHPPPSEYPAELYHPDEWMTFMVKITLGPLGTATSEISGSGRTGWTYSSYTQWVARENEEFVKIIEIDSIVWERADGVDEADPEGFSKIWFTIFHTGLNADAGGRDDGNTWYDELIVSSDSIATPWAYGLNQTAAEGSEEESTPATVNISGGGTGEITGGGTGSIKP